MIISGLGRLSLLGFGLRVITSGLDLVGEEGPARLGLGLELGLGLGLGLGLKLGLTTDN